MNQPRRKNGRQVLQVVMKGQTVALRNTARNLHRLQRIDMLTGTPWSTLVSVVREIAFAPRPFPRQAEAKVCLLYTHQSSMTTLVLEKSFSYFCLCGS
jgi:hypothetical protein